MTSIDPPMTNTTATSLGERLEDLSRWDRLWTTDEIMALAGEAASVLSEQAGVKKAIIEAIALLDVAISGTTFTRPRTGQIIVNIARAEKVLEGLRQAVEGLSAISPPLDRGRAEGRVCEEVPASKCAGTPPCNFCQIVCVDRGRADIATVLKQELGAEHVGDGQYRIPASALSGRDDLGRGGDISRAAAAFASNAIKWLKTDAEPSHIGPDDMRVYHLEGGVLSNLLNEARDLLSLIEKGR